MNKLTNILIIAFLFIAAPLCAQQLDGPDQRPVQRTRKDPFQLMEDKRRIALLRPDEIVERLKLEPGMTIVDVGAGSGIFTFRFAQALEGKGQVFATEIDDTAIKILENANASYGYKNVIPVKVTAEGFDSFYTKHSFDLVFLSGVYYAIKQPAAFFKQLHPFVKDNGRIVIIQPFNHEFFIPESITAPDVNTILEVLGNEGEDFPIFIRLRPETKKYIQAWDYPTPPEKFISLLAADLNNMLADTSLFPDLVDYYIKKRGGTVQSNIYQMQREEGALVKWLVGELDDTDAFGKDDYEKLSDKDKKRLNKLNGLCVRGIFNMPMTLWPVTSSYLAETNSIKNTMEKAGYIFVIEHPVPEHYLLLEFKKSVMPLKKEPAKPF